MTLYDLTGEMLQLFEMAEDDAIDPQILADTLESLEYDFTEKAEQYAILYNSLLGDADTLDKEIKRLTERRDVLRNNADRVKKTLESAMIATGQRKFKSRLYSFNIQKNAPALDMVNDKLVPGEFWITHDPTIDRRALLAAVKADPDKYKDIATLKQSESIRIR